MTPSVVFEHVWKKYRRGERHDTLRDLVPSLVSRMVRGRATTLEASEFWALMDVSFTVSPGEALGLIGPNGAGKSTMLKVLTKILRPTKGRAFVKGRVGSLIEVAAGFHPDLTGRENVFLQGAIMGMPQAEIARKFDAIVDFAGVEDFITTPVKRYSSGMNARLGFAIAAHFDPDVLLIDEVLSVGDVTFQAKCMARMKALLQSGVPLVFVSHNLTAVVDLCTRALLIDRGGVRYDGRPADAVAEFRRYRPEPTAAAPGAARPDTPIHITGVDLLQPGGESSALFVTGRGLTVRVRYQATAPVDHPQFAIEFHNADGIYCAGINTRMDERDFGRVDGAGYVDLVIPKLPLLRGSYSVSAGILDASGMRTYDLHVRAYPFSVLSERPDYGIVYLEHDWRRVETHDAGRTANGHVVTHAASRRHGASGALATTKQELS
jgi:lipopolysaccharide transport system ATP-binding protein